MMRLRPHHLFCATLFQGTGYDEAFTARMEEALAALSRGEPFTLCTGPDSLCAACPHHQGEACALGTRDVLCRDGAALRAVGLAPGEWLPAQAGERLRQVARPQWEAVCGGCRWQREGLCSWELFGRLRQERFV